MEFLFGFVLIMMTFPFSFFWKTYLGIEGSTEMVVTIDVTYYAVATMDTKSWSNFCPKNKITRVLVYLQVYPN